MPRQGKTVIHDELANNQDLVQKMFHFSDSDDVLVFNITFNCQFSIGGTDKFDAKQAFREVAKRVLAAACGHYSEWGYGLLQNQAHNDLERILDRKTTLAEIFRFILEALGKDLTKTSAIFLFDEFSKLLDKTEGVNELHERQQLLSNISSVISSK